MMVSGSARELCKRASSARCWVRVRVCRLWWRRRWRCLAVVTTVVNLNAPLSAVLAKPAPVAVDRFRQELGENVAVNRAVIALLLVIAERLRDNVRAAKQERGPLGEAQHAQQNVFRQRVAAVLGAAGEERRRPLARRVGVEVVHDNEEKAVETLSLPAAGLGDVVQVGRQGAVGQLVMLDKRHAPRRRAIRGRGHGGEGGAGRSRPQQGRRSGRRQTTRHERAQRGVRQLGEDQQGRGARRGEKQYRPRRRRDRRVWHRRPHSKDHG